LPLFPTSPQRREKPRPDPSPPAVSRRQLWLCLDFHRLPLEVFPDSETAGPLAVMEGESGGVRIHQCNVEATRAGLRPGLPLNAALALCPELAVHERVPVRERTSLERLAAWACQYTDWVSIEAPHRLLLEVGGSLKLFGGLAALCKRIRADAGALRYTAAIAVAPTPRAALWLCSARDSAIVTERALLAGRLGTLPLACTGWPANVRERLDGMGILTVGDCLRLPREGFARRLGPGRLGELDGALGRRAETRRRFGIPPVYRGELQLLAETLDQARLCRAMQRLLDELQGFLRSLQKGVQQPVFGFRHEGGWQRLTLGLAEPTADAAFLSGLLAERLERYRLERPVTDLALDSGPLADLSGQLRGLFADPDGRRRDEDSGRRLVDRLRARLGREAVSGLCLLPEHRPEAAWRLVEPGTNPSCAGSNGEGDTGRPFWLLEEPRPLSCRDGAPWLEGPLEMKIGPERIETGWWDGSDVARDYYTASTAAGPWVWVYRERRPPHRWFLHGVFG
jgi:protein ImuB